MDERQSLPEEPQRNEWVAILVRTLVAVLVLGGGYYFAAQYLGGRVPNGTQVEGIDIGGLSPEDARATLDDRLDDMATEPVTIDVEGDTVQIAPEDAGLALDLDTTLAGITGVSYDPSVLWDRVVNEGQDLPLEVTVDRADLEKAVQGVAQDVAIEPTEGEVWLNMGEVKSTESADGRELDVPATSDAVEAVWPQTTKVDGVVTATKPQLAQAEIDRFVGEVAGPAVAGPITVEVDGEKSEISTKQIARLLTITEGDDHTLSLDFDAEGVLEIVSGQLEEATVSPQNAGVVLDGGSPVVTSARVGQVVDEKALLEEVNKAIKKEGEHRVAKVGTTEVEPDITDKDAAAWDFSQMATFRSTFPGGASNADRTENIRVGLGHLNGTVVMPGDSFSLSNELAPITHERGYVDAGVISGGRLVKGIGGGLSQVSTTVLNTAWNAGVQLDEFHPHSYYIERYPVGKEATIAVGQLDNRWTNDTDTPVVIQTWIEGSDIVMTFWGDKKYDVDTVTGQRTNYVQPDVKTDDSENCLPQSPQQGFTITVTRILSQSGSEADRQSYTTTYHPSDQVTCTG
ncbi:VanW family protein [Ornithinimicrobium faecis]|uniref:VanW family protein n=1 Tax=Ornithinimicrobium faecis TaxID=2934158 RepID=A0ABY4YW99_9MICO|nr:VanW family protein [Ornithinimicrobium sp. HY1793]USQ81014.1 VanW family protein [Ornithinimicrobium sp. HY1793]